MVQASQGYEKASGPGNGSQESANTAVANASAVVADTPPDPSGPAARTAVEAPRPKRREAFFDNAKYLAIVLVAVAHSWEPLMDGSRATKALYMVVYTFHMPAFIIISGYFSRSFTATPRQLKRLVTGVAVPYIVFETAYSLLRWAGEKPHHLTVSLQDPWFLTWFLIALFVWRLTTPLWRAIRHPLPVALVIAMLASFCPSISGDLALPRVLQFLPYFVLGLCLKPEHFRLVRRREVRLLSAPVFVCAVAFAYWIAPRFASGWLYHNTSAEDLGHAWWTGPAMQLGLFACSLALTACFLSWVPNRPMWFTVLGAGTICGYLLHGFLIKGAGFAGVFDDHPWLSAPAGEVVVTLLAAVAVTLLCSPPVRRTFRWAVEPDMGWAFRPQD
ncbi:acyltransferase family protein [Streptomyces montanisoli]|uniref:Acyltransferase family protein n=1 Tax=Streptomyces montanisoli TaxID=2798581 RepID=A0A940S011_9ACTN|nr:acyltransferase family protein [Streptomyces montanisoli]MBP0460793.1 acyltransferase family protein [Streptomyces montanisoli]